MEARTDSPHNLIADEQRRLAELAEVLRGVLDGIGALNVFRGRLEETFRDFVWIDHFRLSGFDAGLPVGSERDGGGQRCGGNDLADKMERYLYRRPCVAIL